MQQQKQQINIIQKFSNLQSVLINELNTDVYAFLEHLKHLIIKDLDGHNVDIVFRLILKHISTFEDTRRKYEIKKNLLSLIIHLTDRRHHQTEAKLKHYFEWLIEIWQLVDDGELFRLAVICMYKLSKNTNIHQHLQIINNRQIILDSIIYSKLTEPLFVFCQIGCLTSLCSKWDSTVHKIVQHKEYMKVIKNIFNEINSSNTAISLTHGCTFFTAQIDLDEIYTSLFRLIDFDPTHLKSIDVTFLDSLRKNVKFLTGNERNVVECEMDKYFVIKMADLNEFEKLKNEAGDRVKNGKALMDQQDELLIFKLIYNRFSLNAYEYDRSDRTHVQQIKLIGACLAILFSSDEYHHIIINLQLRDNNVFDAIFNFVDFSLESKITYPEVRESVNLIFKFIAQCVSKSPEFLKMLSEVAKDKLIRNFVLDKNFTCLERNDEKINFTIHKLLNAFYDRMYNQVRLGLYVPSRDENFIIELIEVFLLNQNFVYSEISNAEINGIVGITCKLFYYWSVKQEILVIQSSSSIVIMKMIKKFDNLKNDQWISMLVLSVLHHFDKRTISASIQQMQNIIQSFIKLIKKSIQNETIVENEFKFILDAQSHCYLHEALNLLNRILTRKYELKECVMGCCDCEDLAKQLVKCVEKGSKPEKDCSIQLITHLASSSCNLIRPVLISFLKRVKDDNLEKAVNENIHEEERIEHSTIYDDDLN